MLNAVKVFFTACLLLIGLNLSAQSGRDNNAQKGGKPKVSADSVKKQTDTAHKKQRSDAGKASIRSAIIPGWGQIYNKKYWKLPIVYGALAVPVITYNYNRNWYNKTREAYKIKYYNDTSLVSDLPTDGIDPALQPLSSASLKIYRDEFRQNMDFSILAFLVIWGLQVADAAVDAHLKSFNVTDDLSMKVKPWISPFGRSNGVSLVFSLRESRPRTALPLY
jgi:hypothetical protein